MEIRSGNSVDQHVEEHPCFSQKPKQAWLKAAGIFLPAFASSSDAEA